MAVQAQNNDDDIAAYAQELDFRIEQGRGSLSQSNYDNLRGLWNKIEQIRRQYWNKRMGDAERNAMMASLTTLDRELTNNLHDDQNSRFQNWDPARRTWRNNWWGNTANLYNYNDEIDSYQRQLKQRMDQGRSKGTLTPAEFNRLSAEWQRIERAQQDFRQAGFSYSERNSLMGMLTNFDREITAQLRDNDKSRFNYWDPNKRTWNQKWWQSGWNPGNGGIVPPVANNPGGNQNFNEEIDAYQRDLKQRLDRLRSQGKITPFEMNKLSASYDQIDRKQREFRFGGFNNTERNTLMGMLTQLDRNITSEAHDDDNSRARYWDSKNNTWNNNWWRNRTTTTTTTTTPNPNQNLANSTAFSEEVNQYQGKLRQEINRGQRSGQLTPAEVADLQREFDSIEQLQQQTRNRGFNRGERDALMNRLRALDTRISQNIANKDQVKSASEVRQQWKDERRDERRDDRRDNRWGQQPNNNVQQTQPPATTTPPAVTTPPANNNNNDDNERRRGGRGRQRGND